MHEADLVSRPVNLWYPRPARARSQAAGELRCERFPNPDRARARALELLSCGAALGPVQIEDVETGVIVDRVSQAQ